MEFVSRSNKENMLSRRTSASSLVFIDAPSVSVSAPELKQELEVIELPPSHSSPSLANMKRNSLPVLPKNRMKTTLPHLRRKEYDNTRKVRSRKKTDAEKNTRNPLTVFLENENPTYIEEEEEEKENYVPPDNQLVEKARANLWIKWRKDVERSKKPKAIYRR
jgi:hypothetical protein